MPYFEGPNQAICGQVYRILKLKKGQKDDFFLFVCFILSYPCSILIISFLTIPKRLDPFKPFFFKKNQLI